MQEFTRLDVWLDNDEHHQQAGSCLDEVCLTICGEFHFLNNAIAPDPQSYDRKSGEQQRNRCRGEKVSDHPFDLGIGAAIESGIYTHVNILF